MTRALNSTPLPKPASRYRDTLLVNRQIKDVTRRLDALVEQLAGPKPEPGQEAEQRDSAILRSLPGVGRVVLATLLAKDHQAIQGRDDHALRTLTGVAPVAKRSGKSCRVEMRQACSIDCEQPFTIGQEWPLSTMPEAEAATPRCAPEVIRTGKHSVPSPTGYSGSPASCSRTEPPTTRSTRPLVLQKQLDHWWGVPPAHRSLPGSGHRAPA